MTGVWAYNDLVRESRVRLGEESCVLVRWWLVLVGQGGVERCRRWFRAVGRMEVVSVETFGDDWFECECELDWRCGLHAGRFTPLEEANDARAEDRRLSEV